MKYDFNDDLQRIRQYCIDNLFIDIFEKRRHREYVDIRSLVSYYFYFNYGVRSLYIARAFNMHHSSILHLINTFENRLDNSKEFRILVKKICKDLNWDII